MSAPMHPILVSQVVAQRHKEFHTEADRDRLAHCALQGATPRERRADLAAELVIVAALVLGLGLAVTEASTHRGELNQRPATEQMITPPL